MSQADNANICRHLIDAANNTPDSLAVAVQKKRYMRLCYDEINFLNLHLKSDQIAFSLGAYGIKPGMKAVLMVTPSIDFFALTFALFKAGIIPILVDPGMGVKNLKQCFEESQPDAFIGIPKAHIARRLFGWGKSSIKFLITVEGANFWGGINLQHLLKKYPLQSTFNMALLADNQMAAILFTSGSTGVPKGVVYSHAMFEAQIEVLKHDYGITPGERDLATFPLFSLFGPALGMASVVPDMDASKPIKANPEHIFAAIEKYQCTNLFANPALIEVLGQAGTKIDKGGDNYVVLRKMTSLKRVISAGAPATLSSISLFTKMLSPHVEVINSYGATESLPLTKIGSEALLDTAEITNRGGGICVGYPVKGVDVDIISISESVIEQWDNDLTLPAGEIGEIVVKGPMVSQSYYQRAEATLHAKIKDSTTVRHRMGDLGYLDNTGKLWMCGRKAHRVATTEDTFYSIPCERIFNTHKQVKRTALVGISLDKMITPLLCVELIKNASINEEQLFAELKKIGSAHMQTQAISHFLVHPDFPVDIRHNAKIFREKLAVWAQNKFG